jgi:hypothetical protein
MTSATSVGNIFSTCFSLQKLPLFDTSKVTAFGGFAGACYSLSEVPALDFSRVTAAGGAPFASSDTIGRLECKWPAVSFSIASLNLGAAALNEIYTNLPTATATITVTGNYGVAGDDPTIATAKGWTVDG